MWLALSLGRDGQIVLVQNLDSDFLRNIEKGGWKTGKNQLKSAPIQREQPVLLILTHFKCQFLVEPTRLTSLDVI